MLECMLETLPLVLVAIGIVLLGFIIAAVIVVIEAGTAGTASALVLAVGALLASWWVPITASVLGMVGVAAQACWEQVNAPAPVDVVRDTSGQPLVATGLIVSVTVISLIWAIIRRMKRLSL